MELHEHPAVATHPQTRYERLAARDFWGRAAYELAMSNARRMDALERERATTATPAATGGTDLRA